MSSKNSIRFSLDISDLPSVENIFKNLEVKTKKVIMPLFARLPLLRLLQQILGRELKVSKDSERKALLNLALSAIAKHKYTRDLYSVLVEAIVTDLPVESNKIVHEVPEQDANLAMEILSLMAELLKMAGLNEKALYTFKVQLFIAQHFQLIEESAVTLHQLGVYEFRRGNLESAELNLKQASHIFSKKIPELERQTNNLRAEIYGIKLRLEDDPIPPEDIELIKSNNFRASESILLGQFLRAVDKNLLLKAQNIENQLQNLYSSLQSDISTEFFLIQSRLARRKGLYEKADILRLKASKISNSEKLKERIIWEEFYLARDLKSNQTANKVLNNVEQNSDRAGYQKGLIALNDGEWELAEKFFRDCLETTDDVYLRADCKGNLGLIVNSKEEARRFLYEALSDYYEFERRIDFAVSLSHLAIIEIEEAIFWKEIKQMPLEVIHQLGRAENLLKKAMVIAESHGAEEFILEIIVNRARIESIRGRYTLALQQINKFLTFIEMTYLSLADSGLAAVYIHNQERVYKFAIHLALMAGMNQQAIHFVEQSKARRLFRDTTQLNFEATPDLIHPLLREEVELLSIIQKLRYKILQEQTLSADKRHTLYESENRLREVWRLIAQEKDISLDFSGRISQPLTVERLRQIIFDETLEIQAKEEPVETAPELELQGGGVVECYYCGIYNQLCSTFCSVCNQQLPKTAEFNLNLAVGGATHEELEEEYSRHLFNAANNKFYEGNITEAEHLFEESVKVFQQQPTFFMLGLCRLMKNDIAGAVKYFLAVNSLQFSGKYPFWTLRINPRYFNENIKTLKRDETKVEEVISNIARAVQDYESNVQEANRLWGKINKPDTENIGELDEQ